jgi:hypothetical protein
MTKTPSLLFRLGDNADRYELGSIVAIAAVGRI